MKLIIKQEVKEALERGDAVVALESTIISHGMPYPRNVQTALEVEDVVRDNGAIPATIAIIGGQLRVGLSAEELEYLGKTKGVVKVSRRDIPAVIAKKLDGATTVAATMIIAHLAGIKVFATGGIGGVHRNAEHTFDVSADLDELAHTPVMVVCSGAKSILDLPKTLEYLETKGVTVCGYNTDNFPAFYTVDSGLGVDYNVDETLAAQLFSEARQLEYANGMVVAVPVPKQYAADGKVIEDAIEKSLSQMQAKGIKGKAVTPFLLSQICAVTGGDSLDTNVKLVQNNARVAALIARELTKQ